MLKPSTIVHSCPEIVVILFDFRVDFAPEEDRTFAKKKMVKTLEPQLGMYIFDGSMLFTTRRLLVKEGDKLEFTCKNEVC
jgi:hypothetical protein